MAILVFIYSCIIILLLCYLHMAVAFNQITYQVVTQCVYYDGVDTPFADLGKPIPNIASAEDCQNMCNNNPNCKYFAFGKEGANKGDCWLKGFGAQIEENSERQSGPRCFTVHRNQYYEEQFNLEF